MWDVGFRLWGPGAGFLVQGVGFRFQGLGRLKHLQPHFSPHKISGAVTVSRTWG